MSSQYCPICLFPVYLIIPGYVSGHDSGHLWEFTCLYSACNNFKVSMPESGIITNSNAQVNDVVDYPSWPLQQELPAHTSSQAWFPQPQPQTLAQQSMRPGPIATATNVAQHSPGPATAANRVRGRKPGQKRAPAKKRGRQGSGPPTLKKPRLSYRSQRTDDIPTLERPLSELPNSGVSDLMTQVTDRVNRSVECRQLEAEAAGRVKRALNAFFVYKMVYKGAVTINTFDQQSVTRIVGQSWAMENASVREHFFTLAATDRALHEQAFPDHKSL